MEESTIVADFGSGVSKIGFPVEDQPQIEFTTTVSRSHDEENVYVGASFEELSQEQKRLLITTKPIQRGAVASFDDYESIWDFVYASLEARSEEQSVMIADLPLTSSSTREKILELMFETFLTPKASFFNQSIGSLYSVGKTTGVVLDSGEGKTSCLPIVDGFSCLQSLHLQDIGGYDLTYYLENIFRKQISSKATVKLSKLDGRQLQKIKEKYCFVAKSYEEACSDSKLTPDKYCADDISYELPDGTKVSLDLDEEMFKLPELFFQNDILPSHQFMKAKPLPVAVAEAVARSEEGEKVRRDFFKNLIFTGGNMKMKGMKERLVSEIKDQVPSSFEVDFVEVDDESNSVWLGGSLLASMSTMSEKFITKNEWEEEGLRAKVNKKLSILD